LDDDLPGGWVAQVDPGSGLTYYYNADTQETTWEKPLWSANDLVEESIPVEETLPEPEVDEVTDAISPAPVHTAEDEAVLDDDLPGGWVAQVDPGSGLTYYYNADTQETRLRNPLQSRRLSQSQKWTKLLMQ
jgi:hypothetical protein